MAEQLTDKWVGLAGEICSALNFALEDAFDAIGQIQRAHNQLVRLIEEIEKAAPRESGPRGGETP